MSPEPLLVQRYVENGWNFHLSELSLLSPAPKLFTWTQIIRVKAWSQKMVHVNTPVGRFWSKTPFWERNFIWRVLCHGGRCRRHTLILSVSSLHVTKSTAWRSPRRSSQSSSSFHISSTAWMLRGVLLPPAGQSSVDIITQLLLLLAFLEVTSLHMLKWSILTKTCSYDVLNFI